jgi:hypothetical protein
MKQATGDPMQGAAIDRVADRLTIICGFSELLRDGVYGRLTPRQRRVVETLTKEARQAGLLFLDLLPRGRPSGGAQSALRRSRA